MKVPPNHAKLDRFSLRTPHVLPCFPFCFPVFVSRRRPGPAGWHAPKAALAAAAELAGWTSC